MSAEPGDAGVCARWTEARENAPKGSGRRRPRRPSGALQRRHASEARAAGELAVRLLVVALVLAIAPRAFAERVIVLVAEDPDVPGAEEASVIHRLVGELRSVGLDPVVEVGEVPLEDLLELAHARDAVAVIRVLRDGTQARVCFADRASGAIVVRDIEATGDGHDLTLALRAVELVRASLQPPLEIDAPVEEGEERVAEEEPAPIPAPVAGPPSVAVSLGVNGTWAIGGPGPLISLGAGARWRAIEWLAFGLELGLPIAPPTLVAAEGSADVFVGRLSFDARAMPLDSRDLFQISLGLGVAASWVYVRARANAPYLATDADAFDGSLFARVAGSLEWELLLVELAAIFDWAPAPVSVLVLDRTEAQWGPARIAVTLSVGLRG